MKKLLLLGSIFLFLACSSTISKDDLRHLDGYWEIDQVIFLDGNTKQYKVNTSIDYIRLEGLKGFRKKVQPKLNGSFETSDDAEAFSISKADGDFFINYKTEGSERKEKLIELNSGSFSVINEEGLRYDYSRFEAFDF